MMKSNNTYYNGTAVRYIATVLATTSTISLVLWHIQFLQHTSRDCKSYC